MDLAGMSILSPWLVMMMRTVIGVGQSCNSASSWHDTKHQWSRIRRFPDTILFSNIEPAGMSIRSPWLAMMMTVPCQGRGIIRLYNTLWKLLFAESFFFHLFLALTFRETCFPKVTSPDTVKWSSSSMSGMLSNRVRYSWTWRTKKETGSRLPKY